VVKPIAQSKQSEYFISDKVLNYEITDEVPVSSSEIQDFDLENSRIVQAAFHLLRQTSICNKTLHILDQHIVEGTSIRPPCRFETFHIRHQNRNDVTVILDIAHNPPALKLLIYKLRKTFTDSMKFRFVVGLSSDKDIREFGNLLVTQGLKSNTSKQIHLVEAASNPRAATMENLFSICPSLRDVTYNRSDEDNSIHAQVQSALTLASVREEIVVVCGTVFIMSEVRQALGLNEPCDSKYITSAFGFNYTNVQENFADPIPSTK
jgi:dihydrofolate synthase/folylpolyglutamate synthase